MALVALVGLVGVVGAVQRVQRGPARPATDLETIQFPIQESVVYDRTGTVELARFSSGESRAGQSRYDQIPPILIDAITSVEDKTFWTNTGFDPVGVLSAIVDTLRGNARGASTITQQLVRQRLLDPDLVQDPNRTVERKIKEIIQSVRVTEAYPGVEGKQRIMTAYLNQNYYGNGSYGIMAAARGYFGVGCHRSQQADAEPDRAAGRAPAVAVELRPRAQRRKSSPDGQLCVPQRPGQLPDRRAAQLHPRHARPEPGLGAFSPATSTARSRLRSRQERADLPRPADRTPQWKAPHFVWSMRNELSAKLCADAETCPDPRAGRAQDHHHARLEPAADRREVGDGRRSSCPTRRTRQAFAAADRRALRNVDAEPDQHAGQQRRDGRDRLPDGRDARLRGQRRLLLIATRPVATQVPAPVRRARQRLAPARIGIQAVQLRDRHQQTAR